MIIVFLFLMVVGAMFLYVICMDSPRARRIVQIVVGSVFLLSGIFALTSPTVPKSNGTDLFLSLLFTIGLPALLFLWPYINWGSESKSSPVQQTGGQVAEWNIRKNSPMT
ncbi:MAG: hypothetical protein HY913_04340 [Desulfomonile tiedjei]|nr:hypothetical protein [Desulfomonile tiedjei]